MNTIFSILVSFFYIQVYSRHSVNILSLCSSLNVRDQVSHPYGPAVYSGRESKIHKTLDLTDLDSTDFGFNG
jgi:hypothetical protein